MLPLAAAIVFHECGHLVMLRILKGRVCGFHPAPFGLCIDYDESTLSLLGEAAVCMAGGAVNLFFAFFSLLMHKCFEIDAINFGIVNVVLLVLNSIPAKPLDGGRLLEIIIEIIFGASAAYKASAIITYLFGFVVFLFASYSLLTSQSGIYPLLFSVYLFVCNSKTLEKAFLGEKQRI